MFRSIRAWWVRRKEGRQAKFVHDHEWADSAVDAAARAFEGGGDTGLSRVSAGTSGTVVRHARGKKIPRSD
jgi:hypothetical protein